MKIIIILSLISISSYASEVYFQGPCSSTPFLKGETTGSGLTAGDATIQVLEDSNTNYVGSPSGINSILQSPTGKNALEVVSDTYLRAYGWCYEVDGFQPAAMPDQIKLKGNEIIRWFYAYSNYKDGTWTDYCTPSYELKSDFICKD